MIMLSSFPLSLLLLTIGAVVVRGYEFDHDVNSDLCRTETSADPAICTSNSTMWFSCPISCAAVYSGPRGTMAEERNDPEQFFELRGRRAASAVGAKSNHGSEISLEGNEGYITMFAVVPMLPGMAEYYYHAIEHIAQVYKYTVVAMILPYGDGSSLGAATLRSILDLRNDDHDDDNDNDNDDNDNDNDGRAKSILLEGHDDAQQQQQQQGSTTRTNEILEYLRTRKVVAGSLGINPRWSDKDAATDQKISGAEQNLLLTLPNIFLVAHSGMFIERMLSPTMEIIERRIKVHELAMDNDNEFKFLR